MRRTLLAGTAGAVALSALSTAALGAAAQAQQIGWPGALNPAGAPSDAAASPLLAQPDAWAGFAHVGYHLDPHWRVELQGGYRAGATTPTAGPAAGLCAATLAGAVCGPRDRALGAYAMVANLVYDALPDSRWFDPFAAFGAGLSQPDPSTVAVVNPALQILQTNARSSLAYQALVGLAFRPHDRLHFDLTYRWLGSMGPTPLGQPTVFNSRFYQDQTVAISVRYALFSPKAAVPPAPSFGLASASSSWPQAAPARRTVVVETPSNPAGLAAEAQAAVREAAFSASQGRGSHVVVDGHADTASAADYNSRLSERRAKAMADAMVTLGVPASALDIRWTADGADAQPAAAGAALIASQSPPGAAQR
ncbi:MAG: OmpA family protein [Caulobacteraceae bacterium]|nr:OmpA family protein [Caulobacteraceae bacterium]